MQWLNFAKGKDAYKRSPYVKQTHATSHTAECRHALHCQKDFTGSIIATAQRGGAGGGGTLLCCV